MTKPADDKLAHAKREIKALRVQVEQFKKNDQRRMEMMRGAWLLRQQAKAVHSLILKIGIACAEDPQEIVEKEFERLRDAADKADGAT
jgi:hypothetical protein